ncbi:hypothetical protein QBC43DRAFT_326765 [Cladorrhinum sp. PSN259]|nr:hypothetical protein QBC43DRAFT_326765 [Cladorrhinum sp. PSN259]
MFIHSSIILQFFYSSFYPSFFSLLFCFFLYAPGRTTMNPSRATLAVKLNVMVFAEVGMEWITTFGYWLSQAAISSSFSSP